MVLVMPDHETHRRIDRALTGKEYDWIHKLMDQAAPYLAGHHRRVGHDQETVLAVFLRSGGDLGAVISAEAHLLADREFSRSKKILSNLFKQKRVRR